MSKLQIIVFFCLWLSTCNVYGRVFRMQQDFLGEKTKVNINNNKLPQFPDYRDRRLQFKPTDNVTFAFASYYGDHMVLQQAPQRAKLWGYANTSLKGEVVTVTLRKEGSLDRVASVQTTVTQGPSGTTVWSVLLKAVGAGGPYVITATVQNHHLTLQDVYFGEVWLCSGQSNMQFTVPMMSDAAAEEGVANTLPLIRVFTAAENTATSPLYDLAIVEQPWSVASNASIGHNVWGYFSAVCWTYGRYLHQFLGVPVGLISTTWGGTPVEAWSSPDSLEKCGIKQPSFEGPGGHSVLYNAMLHPFLNLTIKGAIWYQGEANAAAPDTYNCTFPAMIADWREKWKEGTSGQTQDFPFGFVQLGPEAVYAKGKDITRGYPDIRYHQTADQILVPNQIMPNTFMATAVDLTDDTSPYGSVHIRDKQTVGQRLVLSALGIVYGVPDISFYGPTGTGYTVNPITHMLQLRFGAAIYVNPDVDGFEVCCSSDPYGSCPMDGAAPLWTKTPIIEHDATSVTVSWAQCGSKNWIVGMRYLWRETPCTYKNCPIYSVENNLPLVPFTTDGVLGGRDESAPSFRFASYYGDHMVLQQAPQRAAVWGFADMALLGEQVTVTLQHTDHLDQRAMVTTTVKEGEEGEGVWSVLLKAVGAGGPYVITATVQNHNLTLQDVYFGEVWLCSGQSNMQFTVKKMNDAADEEAIANTLHQVRLFTAGSVTAKQPLTDLASVSQKWSVASNMSTGGSYTYFSAVCWVYGRYLHQLLGVPVGLISTTWGGTPVEAWSSPDALKQCGMESKLIGGPTNNSVLYNAMLHPFLKLTIKGAIWYQGEENARMNMNEYNCTFPAMIADWRQKWEVGTQKETSNFPFGFVQLGPRSLWEKNTSSGFPDIRWHQTADYGYVPNARMPNTFMASAVDLTDDKSPWGSVHIRDKLTVGQRLVLSSLALVYRVPDIVYQGPTIKAFDIDIGFYTLKLEMDSPITVQYEKDGFEVCCNHDNQTYCGQDAGPDTWTSTPIMSHDDSSVTLDWRVCAGQWITGLRYLWRVTPCTYKACPVYGVENNLPMTPFIMNGLIGKEGVKVVNGRAKEIN